MSAPAKTPRETERSPLRIRHLTVPELGHAFALCGEPRNDRPPAFKPGDELCVVCAAEYERIRGFAWEGRYR